MAKAGILGTFDVENYGDLLFPILAEHEFRNRVDDFELERFSYRRKLASGWPYPVTPLDQLDRALDEMDALIIGGGHLIRFDKQVAGGYFAMNANIHHPTGYWLCPALAAASRGIPVLWNAPSSSRGTPAWARPILEAALEASTYVSVRDEQTLLELRDIGYQGVACVVPDTVFGLSRLLPLEKAEERARPLLDMAGISGPYVVIQAHQVLAGLAAQLAAMPGFEGNYEILVLPMGPVLGDRADAITATLPRAKTLDRWPAPLDIAALIAASSGCIAISLHLAITALTYGLPVLRHDSARQGKYRFLEESENVFFETESTRGFGSFAAQLGQRRTCSFAQAALNSLDVHWTSIAEIIRQPAPSIGGRPAISFSIWNKVVARTEGNAIEQQNQAQSFAEREASSQRLLADIQERLNESQAEADNLTARVTALVSEQRRVGREFTALKAEYSKALSTEPLLRAALATSEKALNAAEEKQRSLRSALDHAREEIDHAREEIERHDQDAQLLRNQMADAVNEIRRLEGELSTKTEKLLRIRRKSLWPPQKWIPGTSRYRKRQAPITTGGVFRQTAIQAPPALPQLIAAAQPSPAASYDIRVESVGDPGPFGTFSPQAIEAAVDRLRAFEGFASRDYKRFSPDLALVEPYDHFVRYGGAEGRRIARPEHFARLLGLASALDPEMSPNREIPPAAADRRVEALKSDIRIGIYVSSLGNSFMREIAEDLQHDFRSQGFGVDLFDEGASIEDRPSFCVFVAPHEFFWLGRGSEWRRESVVSTGFMFNTEQIQTPWFARALPFLLHSPGVFDIFHQNSALLERAAIPSLHVLPGSRNRPADLKPSDYRHPLYRVLPTAALEPADPTAPFAERQVDVSFFGSQSHRRERFFARNAGFFSKYESFLYCRQSNKGPLGRDVNSEPLTRLAGHVAGHSKITLNIHRDEFGYFEWHRMVRLGMCAGSVVVSDPCLPHPIFKAGEHYLEENIRHLPNMLEWLLCTGDGRRDAERVRSNANDLITNRLDRSKVVTAMVRFMVERHSDPSWRNRLEHL